MEYLYDSQRFPDIGMTPSDHLPDVGINSKVHISGEHSTFPAIIQQVINGLPEEIAILDDQWNILAVNEAWKKTVAILGYSEARPGTNYLAFCRAKSSLGHSPAALAAQGIAEIEAGRRNSFRFTYSGKSRWEGRTFEVCVKRAQILGNTYATATRHDITDMLELRHLREDFSQSLIEGQAEERRRLVREIHDSVMQLLAAAGLTIGQLRRTRQPKAALGIISETEQLLGDTQRELRAIAFLAHPPILEEMGLEDALLALTDGFARRAGLAISLNCDAGLDLGSRGSELALYRVVQEALSNVHRHAGATAATITLKKGKRMIHAVVADNGAGMPTPAQNGLGLPGMQARLSELGGRLTVRHGSPGTVLIASVPCKPDTGMSIDATHLFSCAASALLCLDLGSRLYSFG